jgi:hypothetical protein
MTAKRQVTSGGSGLSLRITNPPRYTQDQSVPFEHLSFDTSEM